MAAANPGARETEHGYAETVATLPNPESQLRNPASEKILILDFGAQVTQLIARRVREAGVYSEIHPHDVADSFVRAFAPRGVILSGSHASAFDGEAPRAPQAVFELGVPVLGICYGMQTMAAQLGGKVE